MMTRLQSISFPIFPIHNFYLYQTHHQETLLNTLCFVGTHNLSAFIEVSTIADMNENLS